MLTDKEMSKDEYEAWKSRSSWFFEVLRERQAEYIEAADGLLAQFSAAPFSFTDDQKQILMCYSQRGAQLQDIIDIDYDQVVKETDNHPT